MLAGEGLLIFGPLHRLFVAPALSPVKCVLTCLWFSIYRYSVDSIVFCAEHCHFLVFYFGILTHSLLVSYIHSLPFLRIPDTDLDFFGDSCETEIRCCLKMCVSPS